MKKILIAGVLGFGLVLGGCAENKTGLEKNAINTGFEKCSEYLTASLKSPSSLRINEASVTIKNPSIDDIYGVFGNLILTNGKISEATLDSKARFREMLVMVRYEAQNSFGVYLAGKYQCQYIYKLENNETSPKSLDTYLAKIKSDGEDAGLGVSIPIAEFTGSNFILNKQIKTVTNESESQFNSRDKKVYSDIVNKFNANKQKAIEMLAKNKLNEPSQEAIDAAEEATAAAAEAMATVGY